MSIKDQKKIRDMYIENCILYYNNKQMELKHGDIVISKYMKDRFVEAVVDFINDDGQAYISEWGKNLNYPTRIIIDKDKLILKDKKIKMARSEFENIITEFYGMPIDFFNLKGDGSFNFGDIVKVGYNKYMFIENLGGDKKLKLFGTFQSTYGDRKVITSLLILSDSELHGYIKTKEEIVHTIFGDGCELKDLNIIEDIDGTPINMVE